jgi:hypothetical protein
MVSGPVFICQLVPTLIGAAILFPGGVAVGPVQLAASADRAEAPITIPMARLAKIKYFFMLYVY